MSLWLSSVIEFCGYFLAFWKCLHCNIVCVLLKPLSPKNKASCLMYFSLNQKWKVQSFTESTGSSCGLWTVFPKIQSDGVQLQSSSESTFSGRNFNIPASVLSYSTKKKIHSTIQLTLISSTCLFLSLSPSLTHPRSHFFRIHCVRPFALPRERSQTPELEPMSLSLWVRKVHQLNACI